MKTAAATLSILSALAVLRLIQVDDGDTLIPMIAFAGLATCGGIMVFFPGLGFEKILGYLGRYTGLHILWLLFIVLGWYLLMQFAPVLLLDLFPLLLLLSINGVVLIGAANPQTFPLRIYAGVGFGLLSALLILEIFLRIYTFPPDSPIGAQVALFDTYISDPAIGHTLKPNAEFFWTNTYREFMVDVTINSLGLRDIERAYARKPDVPRILVLGDSFTEALQVDLSQTPTQIAETCLSQRLGKPVEVINAGLSANGTGQRYLYYVNYGRQFQADVVLLALYPSNDLWDNGGALGDFARLRGLYSFSVAADGSLISTYAKPTRDLIDYLSDDVHLRTFAVLRAIRFTNKQQSRDQYFDAALYTSDFPNNLPDVWKVHQVLVRTLAAVVHADDARFGMVVIPNWRAVEQDSGELDVDRLHEVIDADAADAGIPTLDLKTPARQQPEPLYWAKDGHFNIAGYHLMGEAICEWVIQEGFLEK